MSDAKSLQEPGADIVLASASPARAQMLRAAGLAFRQCPSSVDETALRLSLGAAPPAAVAAALAREKALEISAIHPGAAVIGADQVLNVNGQVWEKPGGRERARAQLSALSGGAHALHSAVCVAQRGAVVWEGADTAHIVFRDYSPEFVERYLEAAGEDILHCAGACQIEALGIHLFASVKGDYFTILGLPLLPLIAYLREARLIAA